MKEQLEELVKKWEADKENLIQERFATSNLFINTHLSGQIERLAGNIKELKTILANA